MGDFTTDYEFDGFEDAEDLEPETSRRRILQNLPYDNSLHGFTSPDFSVLDRLPTMTDGELTSARAELDIVITNIIKTLHGKYNPALANMRQEWYDVRNAVENEIRNRPSFSKPLTLKDKRHVNHVKSMESNVKTMEKEIARLKFMELQAKMNSEGKTVVIHDPPKSPEEIEIDRQKLENDTKIANAKELDAKSKLIHAEAALIREQRLMQMITDPDFIHNSIRRIENVLAGIVEQLNRTQ